MSIFTQEYIRNITEQFNIEGHITEVIPWGNGLINDTFRICTDSGSDYLLQRMNENNYPDLDGLMNNICMVTERIRENTFRFVGNGEEKPSLQVIKVKDGRKYLRDEQNNCWRMYNFMKNTFSIEKAEDGFDVYKAGAILGQFHYLLRDLPAEEMTVIVPDFHNPEKHYRKLLDAARRDTFGRLHEVEKELAFFESMKSAYDLLNRSYATGRLPLRVNHNDPKINNIMYDNTTREPICMVDLDTIMPGLIAYDFGDAIRSCMCTGRDSAGMNTDISLFDRELYENYLKGFLYGIQGILTEEERASLPVGAKLIVLESGIRYLADYLNGDVYLKVRYPGQNLVKSRMHISLAKDMLKRI